MNVGKVVSGFFENLKINTGLKKGTIDAAGVNYAKENTIATLQRLSREEVEAIKEGGLSALAKLTNKGDQADLTGGLKEMLLKAQTEIKTFETKLPNGNTKTRKILPSGSTVQFELNPNGEKVYHTVVQPDGKKIQAAYHNSTGKIKVLDTTSAEGIKAKRTFDETGKESIHNQTGPTIISKETQTYNGGDSQITTKYSDGTYSTTTLNSFGEEMEYTKYKGKNNWEPELKRIKDPENRFVQTIEGHTNSVKYANGDKKIMDGTTGAITHKLKRHPLISKSEIRHNSYGTTVEERIYLKNKVDLGEKGTFDKGSIIILKGEMDGAGKLNKLDSMQVRTPKGGYETLSFDPRQAIQHPSTTECKSFYNPYDYEN